MSAFANVKTLSDLEWPTLLAEIASRCQGAPAKRAALALPFAETTAQARVSLAEVEEIVQLSSTPDRLPLYGLRDAGAILDRLGASGVLGPAELRDTAHTLSTARQLRRFTKARKETMPHLAEALATDSALDVIEDALTDAFDVDGHLADHASPRLRELRVELRTTKARMVSRMEELMRQHAAILSDEFWTDREGRHVLPVRSDAHERFPGLVHGTSASGATLFVEPRVVIPLGNRLKVLEGEVRREEELIYGKLSALLTDRLPSVRQAFAAVTHADLRSAEAKLAHDADLRFVPLADEPILELRAARHPLLALSGVDVVPSDMRVGSGRAVVISGPNAGGKTVVLKTLGLVALMTAAGLPIPVGEGSRVGRFAHVATDVGDEQSLQQNLSTFGAHVQNLATVLNEAGDGALVLLDEVATGTDPREGEALAAAVLDGLCKRGAAVVATTHYEALKTLALGDPRFENASVGFDVATMRPTFELAFGLPGASSALSVARRFGVPEAVLTQAEAFLSVEDRDFDEVVKKLHEERRALSLARSAAETREAQARENEERLAQEITRVRARLAEELWGELTALREQVRKARDEVRGAMTRVRTKRPEPADLATAERTIEALSSKLALGSEWERTLDELIAPPASESPIEKELAKGDRVFVARLRSEAEVVEVLAGGKLRVAAGPLKLTVSRDEVSLPTPPIEAAPPKTKRGGQASSPSSPASPGAVRSAENTCDLRGMRVAEGRAMATQFLDRAASRGLRTVFFLHGQGTGALRDALRDDLRDHRTVQTHRPGDRTEGGDTVTVASLR
jgi:DNA mismatch repair protein MutS2